MKRAKVSMLKYQCPQCGREFDKVNGRSAHIRGIHPDIYQEYANLSKEERVMPILLLPCNEQRGQEDNAEVKLDTASDYTAYLLSEGIKVLEKNLTSVEEDLLELRKAEQEKEEILRQLTVLRDALSRALEQPHGLPILEHTNSLAFSGVGTRE